MTDERGKPAGGRPMTGAETTGADLDSDGSSVETDEDIATAEGLPGVEEIIREEGDRQQ